jgi:hypothetical protein
MASTLIPSASFRIVVAARYWRAARIAISNQMRTAEFMDPAGYLLGMSVEVSLKAYLLNRGFTDKELSQSSRGHDLGALLRLSVEKGLKSTEKHVVGVLIMRAAHIAHFYRYGLGDFSNIPFSLAPAREDSALQTAASLIDRISGDPKTLRTLHQHVESISWPEAEPLVSPVRIKDLLKLEKSATDYANRVKNIGDNNREKTTV